MSHSLTTLVSLLKTLSFIIDHWLERAEDSDPLLPLTGAKPIVVTTDTYLHTDNNAAKHPKSFSNMVEIQQTFDTTTNFRFPFADKIAQLRSIDSDGSLSAHQEHPGVPTPMPRTQKLELTLNNNSDTPSPSSPSPLAKPRGFLVTQLAKPSNRNEHVSYEPRPSCNIELVPISVLPDHLRPLFPFQYFNAMQSKSFESIYSSDHNIVLSAPTGSGKTVCFELAIARLMKSSDFSAGGFKAGPVRLPLC